MPRPGTSFLLASVLAALAWPLAAAATTSRIGFLLGTHGGFGGAAQLTVAEFSPNLDWRARLGVTCSSRDPGKAEEVREIFINDASNGTPRKKGRLWTFALDLLVPVWRGAGGAGVDLYGGPRYGAFTGNFAYVGGNEDFDIRQRTWAFGGGLEHHLPLGGRTEILLQGGADYYLDDSLYGHDTTYTPDNQNVHAKHEFTWADADAAVHQPRLEGRVMAGVVFRLGRQAP